MAEPSLALHLVVCVSVDERNVYVYVHGLGDCDKLRFVRSKLIEKKKEGEELRLTMGYE